MTVLIPKSFSAQTACSLLEPQPKFSPETKILESVNSLLLKIKSLFTILEEVSWSMVPSSKYLQPSNKLSPKPVFFIDFKNCFGMI